MCKLLNTCSHFSHDLDEALNCHFHRMGVQCISWFKESKLTHRSRFTQHHQCCSLPLSTLDLAIALNQHLKTSKASHQSERNTAYPIIRLYRYLKSPTANVTIILVIISFGMRLRTPLDGTSGERLDRRVGLRISPECIHVIPVYGNWTIISITLIWENKC